MMLRRVLTIAAVLLAIAGCQTAPPVRGPDAVRATDHRATKQARQRAAGKQARQRAAGKQARQRAAGKQARQRAALGRCLSALEGADPARFSDLFAACLAEVRPYSKPACNEAWAASGAVDPGVRMRRIARACGEAQCPQLKRPKPGLCARLDLLPSAGVRPRDWTEFHLRALARSLALERSPALLARLAGVFAAYTLPPRKPGVPLPAASGPSRHGPSALTIVVTRDGGYVLDDKALEHGAVTRALKRRHRRSPDATIMISAHRRASYRAIIRLMDAAKAAGFRDMVIVPQDEQ